MHGKQKLCNAEGIRSICIGGMAERPMALVLKTSNSRAFEGSNPSPSALGFSG